MQDSSSASYVLIIDAEQSSLCSCILEAQQSTSNSPTMQTQQLAPSCPIIYTQQLSLSSPIVQVVIVYMLPHHSGTTVDIIFLLYKRETVSTSSFSSYRHSSERCVLPRCMHVCHNFRHFNLPLTENTAVLWLDRRLMLYIVLKILRC